MKNVLSCAMAAILTATGKVREYLLEVSKAYKQNILHLSYNMSGKMRYVLGLSTNCIENAICRARAKVPGAICKHCFAEKTLDHYDSLFENTLANYFILTTQLLTVQELKAVATEIVQALIKNGTHEFRLESFGDLGNKKHATNYLNLLYYIRQVARKNHYKVYVGWWTKNYNLLINAYKELDNSYKKALHDICHVLISSMFVNVPIAPEEKKRVEKALEMPVSVFTVYDPDYIQGNNVFINCGARSCHTCLRCYRLKQRGCWINEELK